MIRVALLLPLAAVAFGLLLQALFQRMVRFDVMAPPPDAVNDEALTSFFAGTGSLLCVGCTRGIGAGIARAACARGAGVIVVGRLDSRPLLGGCTSDRLRFIRADLSSMRAAVELVGQLAPQSVSTVVLTVGIVNGAARQESVEGIEREVAVSFLSRFVITAELLRSNVLASTPNRKPRLFVMGFPGAPDVPQLDDFNWDRVEWHAWRSHMNTVVANDALVIGVGRRESSVNIYGLNPGIIRTGLMYDFLGGRDSWLSRAQQVVIGLVCPSVDDYAPTVLQLVASPQLEARSGTFFNQYAEQIAPCPWLLAEEGNVERVWAEADSLRRRALAVA